MVRIAETWLACVLAVAMGACSSSSASPTEGASNPTADAGGDSATVMPTGDAGGLAHDDAGSPATDDAGGDAATGSSSDDAGGDTGTTAPMDAGTDAADAAAADLDASDGAPPEIAWFCSYSFDEAAQPFCRGNGPTANVVCGTQSGTDESVDAGGATCAPFPAIGSPAVTEPCVTGGPARSPCSVYGEGNWYTGVVTRKCTTTADCALFNSNCLTTGPLTGYCD